MLHMTMDNTPDLPTNDSRLSFGEFLVGLDPTVISDRPEVREFLSIGLNMLLRNLQEGWTSATRRTSSPLPTNGELYKEIAVRGRSNELTKGMFGTFWGAKPLRFHRDVIVYGLVTARTSGVTANAAQTLIRGAEKVAAGEEDFSKVVLRVARIVDECRNMTAEYFLLECVPLLDPRFKEDAQRVHRELYKRSFTFWLDTLRHVAKILNLRIQDSSLIDLCNIVTGQEDASVLRVVRNGNKSYFGSAEGPSLLYQVFMHHFPSMMAVSRGQRIERLVEEEIRRALENPTESDES